MKVASILCGNEEDILEAMDNRLELFVAFLCHFAPGQPLKAQLVESFEFAQEKGKSSSNSTQLDTAWLIVEVRLAT